MREPWIEIEVTAFAEFKISDLWPDGDAPETITKDDVWELINQVGVRRLAYEWFFPPPDVTVTLIDPNTDTITVGAISPPKEEG